VVIDFHTHIFPPEIGANRDVLLRNDPTFGALYSSPKARLARADGLLRSMDEGGIEASVALGFAWRELDACRRHNDYLLEAGESSHGRIVPFGTLPLACGPDAVAAEAQRCHDGGMRGFGELRPDSLGVSLMEGGLVDVLREVSGRGAVLVFHVSEPVGHAYAGKQGFTLAGFYETLLALPEACIVGAHWGGGLPFYASMPEVRSAMAPAYVDTAATRLLYDDSVYGRVASVVGAERILFGSDFPLLSQSRSRRRIEEDSGLEASDVELVLGGNARRLLGLS
jgi:predicted TIM-barrel fold metal-dependent hydrolase